MPCACRQLLCSRHLSHDITVLCWLYVRGSGGSACGVRFGLVHLYDGPDDLRRILQCRPLYIGQWWRVRVLYSRLLVHGRLKPGCLRRGPLLGRRRDDVPGLLYDVPVRSHADAHDGRLRVCEHVHLGQCERHVQLVLRARANGMLRCCVFTAMPR